MDQPAKAATDIAHEGARHLVHLADGAAAVAAFSSPWWWQLLDSWGHMALLLLGIVGGGLRIAALVRDLRKPRP